MTRTEYEEKLVKIIVSNKWDLPSISNTPVELGDIFDKKYHGPDKAHQEALKEYGRSMIEDNDFENRLIGYGLVSYSYFYRSEESAAEKKKKHPKFSEFMCHLLHSDKDFYQREIYKYLSNFYPKPVRLKIGKGQSFWGANA